MTRRNYQLFQGNNRFYCCGRCVSANQIGIMVFCIIVMVIVSALYFAFDARFLLLNIHPIGIGVIFYVIAFLGLFYSVSFILKTGCTDPGIIPRARPDEIDYMISLGDVDPTNTAKGYVGAPARYKTVTVKGQQVKLKWCATCQIWRPPRASHCGLCNNCYEKFDHHCPWVGNCVAKRNYRYFYLFLNTVLVMAVYVMGCNIAVIVLASKQVGFGNALKNNIASIIEFGICGIGAISVAGLACMHTWLIATMQTTNEDIKGTFNPRRQGGSATNPYRKRNCCTNYCWIVCGPFPISLINSRGVVDELVWEEEVAAREAGYGATSSVPKLPPETVTEPQPIEKNPLPPSTSLPEDSVKGNKEATIALQSNSVIVSSTEVELHHQDSPNLDGRGSPETQRLIQANS